MDPWSIPVKTPPPFTKSATEFPMSDTVRLDTCNNCIGKGETRCNLCDGGRKRCSNCVGRGTYYTNGGKKMLCSVCNACGRVSCNDCRGTGWKRCTVCNGNRQSYMYASVRNRQSVSHIASSYIHK